MKEKPLNARSLPKTKGETAWKSQNSHMAIYYTTSRLACGISIKVGHYGAVLLAVRPFWKCGKDVDCIQ